ncbi:MAG: hypothetical protein ACD_71C00236G0007 [uncultured bacterium (gcode 4)]|uniref:Methyltransferase type 11 n=1 Tax=uncultured bacterium (gcode 4) TaxID=1234023 RepID=K1Z3J6_9BACT|nr:MAG: hypothetical protein ACD_71C00236G0007 [uncultured bacterium (gcode 4)]
MNNNTKSEKSHWEVDMSSRNTKSLLKFVENFLWSEEYKIFKKYIPNWFNKSSFFEVWAAPWIYSAIFKKYFDYIPWWIEYTEAGFKAIKRLLGLLKYDSDNFIKWDFLELGIDTKYDLVFSSWFIEHFGNYTDMIHKHIDLTKKWWYTIISVPNYNYIYKNFQEFIYPWLISNQHIVKIMNNQTFRDEFSKIEKNFWVTIEFIWWIWNAQFWHLQSKSIFVQKVIYLIDYIFLKLNIYSVLPKEPSLLLVILKKNN